jgi:hypothetical protein
MKQVSTLLFGVSFFLCSYSKSLAQYKIVLPITYSALNANMLSLWVGKDAGYFDEQGLDVRMLLIRGGSLAVQLLVTGQSPIGLIGGTICYFALNYLSRVRPFRNVDDTLGVIYTHGFAGLAGGLLLGFFADPNIILYPATGGGATDLPGIAGIFNGGNAELFKDELVTGLWVIGFSAIGTFILLKLVGLFVPLRM